MSEVKKKIGLNWRFPWRAQAKTCSLGFGSAICPIHVICKPVFSEKIHPVCLNLDPLGFQMTTIAQNDQNLLRISNFWVKKIFQLLSVTKSKNGPNHLFICQYQCFKEWVRLFLDFQPPLVNTTNVLFEYWTIDATVNFFSEETY